MWISVISERHRTSPNITERHRTSPDVTGRCRHGAVKTRVKNIRCGRAGVDLSPTLVTWRHSPAHRARHKQTVRSPTREPGTRDHGPRTTNQGPGNRTRDHEPGTTDHGPRTSDTDQGSRTRDHGSGTTDQGPRTTDHEPETRDHEPETRDHEPGTNRPQTKHLAGRLRVMPAAVELGVWAGPGGDPALLCLRV